MAGDTAEQATPKTPEAQYEDLSGQVKGWAEKNGIDYKGNGVWRTQWESQDGKQLDVTCRGGYLSVTQDLGERVDVSARGDGSSMYPIVSRTVMGLEDGKGFASYVEGRTDLVYYPDAVRKGAYWGAMDPAFGNMRSIPEDKKISDQELFDKQADLVQALTTARKVADGPKT